ncbi:MAG: GNAT family N-acetyltransferase [Candidatus Omnitrophota bacterium]
MPSYNNIFYANDYLSFIKESKRVKINYFKFCQNKDFAIFPYIRRRSLISSLRYGGIWTNSNNAVFITKARKYFLEYCRQNNIKKVQIRNNPFIKIIKIGHRAAREPFVYIDLWNSSSELKNAISDRHLKCIQRAMKENLTFKEALGLRYLKTFYRLYKETLEAKGVKAEKLSYFTRMLSYLKNSINFAYIEHEGEIIAISMILKSKDSAFMMYGGTSVIGYKKYAKHFMIYNLIFQYKKRGYRRLILGTGSQPGDSVYQFKRGFTDRDSYIDTYETTV